MGKGEEQPFFAAPSLTRANTQFPRTVHRTTDHRSPASSWCRFFSLFGSPNKQAKSFGVLCLAVGVCFVEFVFFSGIPHTIDF